MKKIISILMMCSLLLCACAQNYQDNSFPNSNEQKEIKEEFSDSVENGSVNINDLEKEENPIIQIPPEEMGDDSPYSYEVDFESLDDDELLSYIQDDIYLELVTKLNSDKYYVSNVSAVYVSKEYLEEVEYNSKSNIFFGYTLEDIKGVYGDEKYVFSLGDNGETIVKPFEDYDDTYEQIIKNVAIGTGVILICITVSVVTGGGAPAVSLIFATSAKTGTIMALSSGTISSVTTGIITGIETGDMEEAINAGALAGSESFKWGAITGAIAGGISEGTKYADAVKSLKGIDINLTTQQAAAIQMETGYPVEIISQFHTMEEYQIFKEAGLKAAMVDGKIALIRNDIDLTLKDEFGRSNLERMQKGLSALDINGNPFELHHVGQEANGAMAILTRQEHDNAVLHGFKNISEIDRNAFATQRSNFWKDMAIRLTDGAL